VRTPSRYDNLIFQSHAGSGKTAAFGMAALIRVNENKRVPQVLIIAPTKFLVCWSSIRRQLCLPNPAPRSLSKHALSIL
jgi:hypothetical protein